VDPAVVDLERRLGFGAGDAQPPHDLGALANAGQGEAQLGASSCDDIASSPSRPGGGSSVATVIAVSSTLCGWPERASSATSEPHKITRMF